MRYGMGRGPFSLTSRFGDVKFMLSNSLTINYLPKTLKCLFVGYPKEMRGCYVYCPSDNKVFVVRNGFLLERILFPKETVGVR